MVVGRDRERRALAAARSVALITGPAGVGKTALVASVLAQFAPAAVLSGTARIHSPAPYDWLASVLSGRDLTALDLDVPPDALAWLAQHDAMPVERFAPGALLRVAVRVVRSLVGAGPAVLVVEDMHALDPASLNLVGELATTPGLPALLVVTSRPASAAASAESSELVARTLARLAGVPGAVRQHLGPLPVSAVADLLASAYPDVSVPPAALWERTGGNPYAITELLASGPESLASLSTVSTVDDLTAREAEVLARIGDGMSNKQIARSLGISVRTVTVHVSNLLRKTGSASRTEAALWAVRREAGRGAHLAASPAPGK
jgi:DNA-binding CsgD family transcriptional regulator